MFRSDMVKVSKIDIKIGDKTLSLSLEEAKELKDRLKELFPDNITTHPFWPNYIPIPYPVYRGFEIDQPPPYKVYWETTCGDSSNVCFTCKS